MKTFANKSPREKGAMQTLYFNLEQTRELRAIGGSDALVVMQHYVAIAHQANPNMEDTTLSNILDMPIRTVERVRLALTKADWFRRIKTTIKGEPHIMYAVGKEAVNSYSAGRTAVLATNNKSVTKHLKISKEDKATLKEMLDRSIVTK